MEKTTSMILIDSPNPWGSLEELKDFWQGLKEVPPGPDKQDALWEFREVLKFRKEQGLPVFDPS